WRLLVLSPGLAPVPDVPRQQGRLLPGRECKCSSFLPLSASSFIYIALPPISCHLSKRFKACHCFIRMECMSVFDPLTGHLGCPLFLSKLPLKPRYFGAASGVFYQNKMLYVIDL